MDISANSLGHPLAVMSEAADHYDGVHQYDLAERMRNARSLVSLHDETLALLRRSYADALARHGRLEARINELEAQLAESALQAAVNAAHCVEQSPGDTAIVVQFATPADADAFVRAATGESCGVWS